MANIYIKSRTVPAFARNKRIYSRNASGVIIGSGGGADPSAPVSLSPFPENKSGLPVLVGISDDGATIQYYTLDTFAPAEEGSGHAWAYQAITLTAINFNFTSPVWKDISSNASDLNYESVIPTTYTRVKMIFPGVYELEVVITISFATYNEYTVVALACFVNDSIQHKTERYVNIRNSGRYHIFIKTIINLAADNEVAVKLFCDQVRLAELHEGSCFNIRKIN